MKYQRRNPIKLSTTLGAMLLSSALLASCGSGGGSAAIAIINAGIGGTGIVFGTITGFGSVWVNGRRFEIDDSEIIVDGESGTAAELAMGMVVRLDVETDNGMFAGAAKKLVFDDAIQGPLNGAPTVVGGSGGSAKRFTILEQNISIDASRTLFNGTSFAAIDDGDVVEVSGFRTSATEIVATWVRKIDDTPPIDVELRGIIEDLTVDDFRINGVKINYDTAIEINVEGGLLEEGMLVEIEGLFVSHTEVDALEIEQEDENFGDDGDDISLHGIVSGYDPAGVGLADFLVNGQRVDASTAEFEPENLESLMQNGLEVEVEGEIVGGILVAEELELREGDSEVRATVFDKDIDTGTFIIEYPGVGMVTVATSGLTVFEDESATPIPGYSFQELVTGHFVEVEGIEVNDTLSAQIVKRREPNDFKLQGAADAIDSVVFSITILGITYPMDPAAIYQEDPTITATQFFDPSNLMIGDIVALEDAEPDGFADEVELDD